MTGGASEAAAAVLADIERFAAAQGWDDLRDYTAGLPAAGDRAVLLIPVADADVASVTAAYSDPPLDVYSGPLAESLAPALGVNRVIVALRCGALFDPEMIAAVRGIIERPGQTFLILLSDADALTVPDELDLVQRRAWRLFVGVPGTYWTGQDLAERNCLLWSGRECADFLRDRLARDRGLLTGWLAATPGAWPELALVRAADLLAQFGDRIERGETDEGDRTRIAGLCEAAAGTRQVLRQRLRPALLTDLIVTSLHGAEHAAREDAAEWVTGEVSRVATDKMSDKIGGRVGGYVERAIEACLAELAPRLRRRFGRLEADARDLLSGRSWDEIGELLAAAVPAVPRIEDVKPGGTPSVRSVPSDRGRALRRQATDIAVASAAGIGTVAAQVVLGSHHERGNPLERLPGALPAGVGAATVTYGVAAERGKQQELARLVGYVQDQVTAAFDELRATYPDAVQGAVDEWRSGLEAATGEAEAGLRRLLEERSTAAQSWLYAERQRLADAKRQAG